MASGSKSTTAGAQMLLVNDKAIDVRHLVMKTKDTWNTFAEKRMFD